MLDGIHRRGCVYENGNKSKGLAGTMECDGVQLKWFGALADVV